jgi:predicted amidohydrolase
MRRGSRLYRRCVTCVRVAAVQDSPVLLDRAATLDRVDELTDRAAGQGAGLVVFPEALCRVRPCGSMRCRLGVTLSGTKC